MFLKIFTLYKSSIIIGLEGAAREMTMTRNMSMQEVVQGGTIHGTAVLTTQSQEQTSTHNPVCLRNLRRLVPLAFDHCKFFLVADGFDHRVAGETFQALS